MSGLPERVPLATYRIQFRNGMDLERARSLVPYLRALGVDTLYTSPVFAATSGSTHGYDVTDPTAVDPALGGLPALRALARELRAQGMGLLLDIVPNHMAASIENPWWVDLLANGQDGDAGTVFDVDWSSGQVMLPILAEPFGEAVASGKLRAEPDALVYEGLRLPLRGGTEGETDVDALVAKQHYRPVWWRLANHAINYRRFFDINDLVCVRAEDEQVAERTHRSIVALADEGLLGGVRVDHVDGLADPQGYLEWLAGQLPGDRPYVLVEKILGEHERLPAAWPVAGTTGYEFITTAEGVLHDPDGVRRLQETWERFTGETASFEQIVHAAKRDALRMLFGAEVAALTARLAEAARDDAVARDIPEPALREAVVESVVRLPVYRPYVRGGTASREDSDVIEAVLAGAARASEAPERRHAIGFLRRVLTGEASIEGFITRWQQLTGPAMAKGFEDTALYRYTACVSRNDVGGDPGSVPPDVAAFHRFARARAAGALNAGSTHDTKRSEDVRARIAALTFVPEEWERALDAWARMNRRHGSIDPSAEVLLYQTLVGTWAGEGGARYRKRIEEYMVKAAREAKRRTSWLDPDDGYERELRRFVRGVLRDERFTRALDRFVEGFVAWPGAVNSMAALVLRICSPGVPDVYNGTELWDLRLVDPDNRTPVDFDKRAKLLRGLPQDGRELVEGWRDGRLKLFVMARALAQRPRFARGSYMSLAAPDSVVAFARRQGSDWTIAVVPRRGHTDVRGTVRLPGRAPRSWSNVFTDEQVRATAAGIPLGPLLKEFPVALLSASGRSARGSRPASARR